MPCGPLVVLLSSCRGQIGNREPPVSLVQECRPLVRLRNLTSDLSAPLCTEYFAGRLEGIRDPGALGLDKVVATPGKATEHSARC